MKLSAPFTLLASFIPLLPLTHALVASTWSMTNVSSTGLTDITFPITIVETSHTFGYFFSQQFDFVGVKNGGYIGIQPHPDSDDQAVLRAVFSIFEAGTTTSHPNCHDDTDSGPGVSCSVDWNGVYGNTYNFEVENTGGTTWVATAVDTVTGAATRIGSFTLPAGAGGIESSQHGFVDWYPWKSGEPPNCARLPYQKTIFGHPSTTNAGSVGTQDEAYEYGDCVGKVAFHTEQVTGGVENNCGFKGMTGRGI